MSDITVTINVTIHCIYFNVISRLFIRLQDGRVVYVTEVLVVIQYRVLVVRSGYARSVVGREV